MTKFAVALRRFASVSLALVALLPGGCFDPDESGDDGEFACVYDYSVYRQSEYGSSFDEYDDNCITVSSREACDDFTDSSTECAGGSCADYSYTNVSVIPGSCDGVTGGGADDSSSDNPSSSSACEWTNDGECDESEGTGLCPAGTDSADCSGSSSTCPWTNDGECDEPEGTGLCAEGTDWADC